MPEELSKMERITKALDKAKWTSPLCLRRWAEVFGVKDTRTVKKWFKDGVIKNKRLSARCWCIAIEEIPFDLLKAIANIPSDEVGQPQQVLRDYIERTAATGRPRPHIRDMATPNLH